MCMISLIQRNNEQYIQTIIAEQIASYTKKTNMMISKTIYRGSRSPAASRIFTNATTVSNVTLSRSLYNSSGDSKSTIKQTLEDVNKKVGQAAAEGLEKTEEASHKVGENIQQAEEKVKNIFSKTSADAKEKAEQGKEHLEAKGRESVARGKEKLDEFEKKHQ